MFDIIPEESKSTKEQRYIRDRHCYMQGKSDAEMSLNNQSEVQYTDSRDIDCYNMGYNSNV